MATAVRVYYVTGDIYQLVYSKFSLYLVTVLSGKALPAITTRLPGVCS